MLKFQNDNVPAYRSRPIIRLLQRKTSLPVAVKQLKWGGGFYSKYVR